MSKLCCRGALSRTRSHSGSAATEGRGAAAPGATGLQAWVPAMPRAPRPVRPPCPATREARPPAGARGPGAALGCPRCPRALLAPPASRRPRLCPALTPARSLSAPPAPHVWGRDGGFPESLGGRREGPGRRPSGRGRGRTWPPQAAFPPRLRQPGLSPEGRGSRVARVGGPARPGGGARRPQRGARGERRPARREGGPRRGWERGSPGARRSGSPGSHVSLSPSPRTCPLPSRRPPHPQEALPLFEIPDPGAGARVLLQRVHQQGEAAAAVPHAEPDRPASEDLVSEPEDEGKKTQQRPAAVFLGQPSAVTAGRALSGERDRGKLSYFIFIFDFLTRLLSAGGKLDCGQGWPRRRRGPHLPPDSRPGPGPAWKEGDGKRPALGGWTPSAPRPRLYLRENTPRDEVLLLGPVGEGREPWRRGPAILDPNAFPPRASEHICRDAAPAAGRRLLGRPAPAPLPPCSGAAECDPALL